MKFNILTECADIKLYVFPKPQQGATTITNS